MTHQIRIALPEIRFLAPTSIIPVPSDVMTSSGLCMHCMHVIHIHRCRQCTYTQNIKTNKSLNMFTRGRDWRRYRAGFPDLRKVNLVFEKGSPARPATGEAWTSFNAVSQKWLIMIWKSMLLFGPRDMFLDTGVHGRQAWRPEFKFSEAM